jgi:hypothetical protein
MTDSRIDNDGAGDERVEAALKDTFRRHEYLADGAAPRLLPAVRAGLEPTGRARPRVPRWAIAAAAVVVAAGAVPVTFALMGPADPPQRSSGPATGPDVNATSTIGPAPVGWRWESSLGLVARVPDAWAVNDFGCNQTDGPTVVRGYGPAEDCFTPEPLTKELANFVMWGAQATLDDILAQALLDPATARSEVEVDGLAAVRYEGQTPDGRHAGVILVAGRGSALMVRTHSQETTLAILDSLHVPDVDHVGCVYRRPDVFASVWPGDEFVDPQPVAISVCHYGPPGIPANLFASGELTGADAVDLAALINTSTPGGNPDVPPSQCVPGEGLYDAMLRVQSADGAVRFVWAAWSDCIHRGLTDGVNQVQVTRSIVAAINEVIHLGYGLRGDLPE